MANIIFNSETQISYPNGEGRSEASFPCHSDYLCWATGYAEAKPEANLFGIKETAGFNLKLKG